MGGIVLQFVALASHQVGTEPEGYEITKEFNVDGIEDWLNTYLALITWGTASTCIIVNA